MEEVLLPLVRKLFIPAVGSQPVSAAACSAARDIGPVPQRPTTSITLHGGLQGPSEVALGAGLAATPAWEPALRTPVKLNDVAQRHIHFVGHWRSCNRASFSPEF